MMCVVCFKELEGDEEELCQCCAEFFAMQYPDVEERERVLDWFKQNAGPDLS